MPTVLLAILALAQTTDDLRRDADALAPMATTAVAKDFLRSAGLLPSEPLRTLHYDPASKTFAKSPGESTRPLTLDVHTTRYGSPLAYTRPVELLGKDGLDSFAGKKVLDFGCGGIGSLRLMAALGADAVGIDVDPMLEALYREPGDQGPFRKGRVSLVIGRYPADEAVKAKVGGGYDLILSKNTMKRGYIHPEEGRAYIDFGMSDLDVLKTLHAALRPGGRVMIYNLGPAQGKPFKPMADIRTPFSRADWEAAGFRVVTLDQDDTATAREMAAALGWEKLLDIKTDLFANYTLVQKP